MLANDFLLFLEALVGTLVLLGRPYVKEKHGDQAAAAASVAGGALLVPPTYEFLSRVSSDFKTSAVGRGLSLLTISSVFLLIVTLVFPFIKLPSKLILLTPLVLGFGAYASSGQWKIFGYAAWGLLPIFWLQQLYLHPAIVGNPVVVVNNCKDALDLTIASKSFLGGNERHSWLI